MPWERVEEWLDFWLDYPPLHILVRGAVGYEPKKTTRGGAAVAPRPSRNAEDLAKLAAKFGGQVVKIGPE